MPRYSRDELIQRIRQVALANRIDPDIAVEQLRRESGNFNPIYVYGPGRSPAGAQGLAQFMPGTWARYGRGSPFDPDAALEAWAKYMRDLLERFGGRYDVALAGYNSGENRTEYERAAREGRQINWRTLPRRVQEETEPYVREILAQARRGVDYLAQGLRGSGSAQPSGRPDVAAYLVSAVSTPGVRRQIVLGLGLLLIVFAVSAYGTSRKGQAKVFNFEAMRKAGGTVKRAVKAYVKGASEARQAA